MNYLIGVLIAILLPATAVVGAMALNLRSSDPAGNGLALVYTLFFTAVLWGLLGITLLIAGARAPSPSLPVGLPWRWIGIAVLVLFLAAAASQIASVIVLSDRRTTGLYQLALRAAFFLAPLAFILHCAWRTYGPPVPVWAGTWLCAGAAAVCIAMPWPGAVIRNRPTPPPRKAEDLRYPAVLIWGQTRVEPIDGPGDLATMHSERVLNREQDPVLIDSMFRQFRLANLRLRDGALKLMVTGQGQVAVEFRLEPVDAPATAARARELILACRWLATDPDRDAKLRERLAQRETIENMIEELRAD